MKVRAVGDEVVVLHADAVALSVKRCALTIAAKFVLRLARRGP